MKKNKQGFTLIELLVVIAIIGLLATLSVVALNTARVKARDAKRLSDIRQIQTALELHFNAKSLYPVAATAIVIGSTTQYNICEDTGVTTSACTAGKLLITVPKNPTPVDGSTCSGNEYKYTSADGKTYTLNYCLSSSTTGVIATASPSGIQ